MVKYNNTSPYAFTQVYNDSFLDIMENREIFPRTDDAEWEINQTYHMRPDLLAHDLYDDSRLWWVFAQRNPNRLKDPMFDFTVGTKIFLPKIENLKNDLGL